MERREGRNVWEDNERPDLLRVHALRVVTGDTTRAILENRVRNDTTCTSEMVAMLSEC